jgi:hypothetical protein
MGLSTSVKRILRLARNVVMDLRYGGFLGGNQDSRYAAEGAHPTVNSDYQSLDLLFRDRIRPDDVLVDVGCGRGRVLNYWLSKVPNRVVGLELDPEIAEETASRLKARGNVKVVAGDAIANLPTDGTLFYLYNPFEEPIVRRFADRCVELYRGRANVRFFYTNPEFGHVFTEDSRWKVEKLELPQPWSSRTLHCWVLSLA